MSTLSELVHYCNDEKPVGAMLMIGEWGCGKTWLITEALAKALAETHMIVRVSLFGIDSISDLKETLHRQWLYVCAPLLSKVEERKEKLKGETGLISVLSNLLAIVNPAAGNMASTVMTFDPIDYIPMEPEVVDLQTGEKKQVVLVFDDPDRTRLNRIDLLGCINNYCENQKFHTIVVASEQFISTAEQEDSLANSITREKVIAYHARYVPEYAEVVHSVLTGQSWRTEEYGAFLAENEALILDVFAGGPQVKVAQQGKAELAKTHNLRSLSIALKQFFRIYSHLTENGAGNIRDYLASFLAFALATKSGLFRNGKISFQISEEEIASLYPQFSSRFLPPTVREWIQYGIWDSETFDRELAGDGLISGLNTILSTD